jgi:type VI protein secretion system component VasK
MILALVIVWLVVIGATAVWVGLKGWRLYKLTRRVQAEIEHHVIQANLHQLPSRLDELKQRQERMNEALDRLRRSVAELRVLLDAFADVRGRLPGASSMFRRA